MLYAVADWLKGVIADVHPTVKFGENTFVWSFAVICEGVEIGGNSVVGSNSFIGKNCKIGDRVRIQSNVFLSNGTIIEDDVIIGPGVSMTDDKYPIVCNPSYLSLPPYIERGCSIGAGAVILPGVRIGEKALVGAGAVVTRDVPSGTTVVGCPAKINQKSKENLNE